MQLAFNSHPARPTSALTLPRLHLGPMSKTVVDAAIAVAHRENTTLCLIASRRQIDCAALGGGYVNNWTTESFADYVRARDPAQHIMLARDHSGPWQREDEAQLILDAAMQRAFLSQKADIDAGFTIIHLDPEKAVTASADDPLKLFTDLTLQMLTNAALYANQQGRPVYFEIGTDEGIAQNFTPDQWRAFLENIFECCTTQNLPLPVALATPLGTKTKEMRNVGGMVNHDQAQIAFWQTRIAALQHLAQDFNITLKLHNFDYMPETEIVSYRALGITIFNVAPEFGVVESRTVLSLLRAYGLDDLADKFIGLAVASNKWQRWLLPDSQTTHEDKAIIAGHYCFAVPACLELRRAAAAALAKHGIDLEAAIQTAVEQAISHYL